MSRIYLCISIDCECDKGRAWRTQRPRCFTGITEGIAHRLDPLFRHYLAKPTYLLSPEVLADEASVECLRELPGSAELGTHLHGEYAEPGAWDPDVTAAFQRDYPRDLERAKLAFTTAAFQRAFGRAPRSFRAGRFGVGQSSLELLDELGYTVDSSVTPFVDWSGAGAPGLSFVGAPTQPYHPSPREPARRGRSRLTEVPVTIRPRRGAGRLLDALSGPRWLRPTRSSGRALVALARDEIADARAARPRAPVVMNAMFHNVEVIAGASPYAASEGEAAGIVARLCDLLAFARAHNIITVGLADVPELM